MAFDLLYHDRRDLTGRPLRERRARLEDVVANNDLVFPVRRLAPGGLEAWKQVVERRYEGYAAKDEASVYEGGPTRRWLKVKQKDWTVADDGWRRRVSAAPDPVPPSLLAKLDDRWQPALGRQLSEPHPVRREERSVDVDQTIGAADSFEGSFEIFQTPHRSRIELQSQCACCLLHFLPLHWVGWMPRMREYRHVLECWKQLPEQFQALPGVSGGIDRQSGDVTARARQALDESDLHRVTQTREDDGDRRGRLLGCDPC
jgi:ATP dependent DNA ligase domain